MENDILDSLEDLGYDGALCEEEAFREAVLLGPTSVEYTKLVAWLTSELKNFCGLEECANQINSPDEASNFIMELSSCLRELNCPYNHLFEGNQVSDRLNDRNTRLQLLDYLTSELASVRIVASKRPGMLKSGDAPSKPAAMNESDVAKHLRMMLMTLGFPKPPPNITPFQLFSKVETKVKDFMTQHPNQTGKSLLKCRLSDKQWEQVIKMNDALMKEYMLRREMLLKRLDVTIQSFMWADKAKNKENEIAAVYQPIRKSLSVKPDVGVAQVLAARDDLTRLQKTSSGYEREKTKCAINRVLIPKVPDRGGRAWELEPPPPEMPSFMKRDAGGSQQQRPQSGRGGGYQGRGGRGGGYQGGGGQGGGYQGSGGQGSGYQGGGYQGGGGQGGGYQGGGRGGKIQGGWGDSQGHQSQGGNWAQGGGGYGNRGGGQGGYNQGQSQGYSDNYQGGSGGRGGGGGGRRGSARGGRGGRGGQR